MEVESQVSSSQNEVSKEEKKINSVLKLSLLVLNCLVLAIGNSGGPLVMRLYFIHGGSKIWLSSWLETGGWPIMFIPLSISYLYRRGTNSNGETKVFFITPYLFMASAGLGLLTGLDDFFYAYGVSHLPISTTALIQTTHLAFTAGFAFLIVKQKFTSYSINSIVLLTVGAVLLGLHGSSDRPNKESNKEYYIGFFMIVATAALYGFILPMVELTYKKAKQTVTYTLVMEMQMVMSLFSTVFCTIGMLISNDFQAIPREAKEFKLGKTMYYVVLASSAILWQFFFMGVIGVIFCASSLLSAVVAAVLLPLTQILGVLIYHEKFKAEKAVALFLSLWGFASYMYGEFKGTNKNKKAAESKTATLTPSHTQTSRGT
ncbi:hypothetical protein Syun_004315 [Stephania yunnanensis]|uniref:Probable purine permease n=1 Tax=Stephania yunnanensis TaxID=152371 RepID=A0AAP0L467_9MAGN